NARTDLDALIKKQAELVDKITETNKTASENIGVLQYYRDEIVKLGDKTDKTAEDHARMQAMVEGLNKELGESKFVYDEVTGKIGEYADATGKVKEETDEATGKVKKFMEVGGEWRRLKESTDEATGAVTQYIKVGGKWEEVINGQIALWGNACSAIDDVVEAKMREIRLEASREKMVELVKAQDKAQRTYGKALAEAEKAQETYNNAVESGSSKVHLAQQALREKTATLNEAEDTLNSTTAALDNETQALTNATMATEGMTDSIGAFLSGQPALEAYVNAGSQNFADFQKALEDTGVSTEELASLSKDQLRELARSYDGTTSSISKTLDGYRKTATAKAAQAAQDVFGVTIREFAKMPDASKTYADGVIASIEGSLYRYDAKAAKWIAVTSEEALESMADASVKQGEAFKKGYEDPMYKADGKAAAQMAQKAEEGAGTADGTSAGASFANGFVGAINSRVSAAYSAGRQLAAASDQGARSKGGVDARSPSKKAQKTAGDYVKGFVDTLKKAVKKSSKAGADLAKAANSGLEAGLKGSESQVKSSTDSMMKSLTKWKEEALKAAKSPAEKARIEKVFKAAKGAVKDYGKELQTATKSMDGLNKKIAEQEKAVEAAKKEMQDYASSIKDAFESFFGLSNISEESLGSVSDMIGEMSDSLKKAQKYAKDVEDLQKRGLDKAKVDELLKMGADKGAAYADALSKATDAELAQINKMQAEITQLGASLGDRMAKEYYQAGVDAAQGVLKGLKDERSALEQEMKNLAQAMVKALQKELKIKSPSVVMRILGRFVPQGVGEGVKDDMQEAVGAVEDMADAMVAAAQRDVPAIEVPVEVAKADFSDLTKLKDLMSEFTTSAAMQHSSAPMSVVNNILQAENAQIVSALEAQRTALEDFKRDLGAIISKYAPRQVEATIANPRELARAASR
ncbi:MAG: hypothetical protein FWE94_08405, partial [Coriobacteriia bacterium]|nr:hypothetical protein [Coriobacteriia bacterium]